MDATTLVIVVAIPIAGAVWGLRARRRSQSAAVGPNVENGVRPQAEQWGVRITAPDRGAACARVREFLEKEFPMDARPPLPLADCPFPHQCDCRYIKLFDRRVEDRRSGRERRVAGQRFEKDRLPRRSGHDRRKKIDWF